jgi:hypothetical protein
MQINMKTVNETVCYMQYGMKKTLQDHSYSEYL